MERFDFYPAGLIGDSAYGEAEMLNWLVHDRGIEPRVALFDKSKRTDGTFSREDFIYTPVTLIAAPAARSFSRNLAKTFAVDEFQETRIRHFWLITETHRALKPGALELLDVLEQFLLQTCIDASKADAPYRVR